MDQRAGRGVDAFEGFVVAGVEDAGAAEGVDLLRVGQRGEVGAGAQRRGGRARAGRQRAQQGERGPPADPASGAGGAVRGPVSRA